MKTALTLAVPTLMLAASLTACGDDTPPVCHAVDELQASTQKVTNVDVTSSTALTDLESGLISVRTDLTDVKTEAKSEYNSQISAVETSYTKLKTSAQAAVASPSAATLSAAQTALATFGNAAQTLVKDIQSTC